MEKNHEEMKGCCHGSMCGAGCCQGHLWKWVVGILFVLVIFWLGMRFGFSKAMRKGGRGRDGGGCGMSKYWGDEGGSNCSKDGGCPTQQAIVESDTTTTGS